MNDGGRAVNKGEFAQVLAERTELSKAAAGRALDGILETLTEAMVERDEVSFTGWGKFNTQRRKGRDAHDPRNPQRIIHVAPAYVPKFKAGSVLKPRWPANSQNDRPKRVDRRGRQPREQERRPQPLGGRGPSPNLTTGTTA